ncbi:MAG: hypothetical protein KDC33_00165 [Thermoleophilia bacterium]|nr:hypothetical protein [Thermoleophilia bacterium]
MADKNSMYLVRFRAREDAEIGDDATERLRDALTTMPGIGHVHGTTLDPDHGIVTGEFQVDVTRGIGAASRDGARVAKEALKVAGFPDAQIVELWVGLRDEPS